MDRWRNLCETIDLEATVKILDDDIVEVLYPDGSRGTLTWHEQHGWVWANRLDSAPGDVAARDSL